MTQTNIRDRKILFLSRDNGCLSLIANAIAKKLLPPKTQIFTAGLKHDKIDPRAVLVLREFGIHVSGQEVKEPNVVPTHDIDLVVILADKDEVQPTVYPRASRRTTWEISDPCRKPGADLNAFRRARDEINVRVGGLFLDHWRNPA